MQEDFSALKEKVYNYCKSKIDSQLESLQSAIQNTRESLYTETKSTAGDKHETGRAMIQLEQEKLGEQFQELRKQKLLLDSIVLTDHTIVESGALVKTTIGLFFIAVGLGQQTVEDTQIFIIAPVAPLAQSLLGKSKGDTIVFNGRNVTVEQII